MKILQLVPYFYPAWAYGGPGKLVYDLGSYFAKQGHEVIIYASDAFSADRRMNKSDHVKQKKLVVRYFYNWNNFFTYHYNIFFTPGLYLKALFELHKFDVVHIHDFYTLQNFYVGFLCRLFKKPYVLSVHGCLEEKRLAQRSLFKKFFLNLYGYQLLKHAKAAIASSENEITAYQEYGIAKDKIYLLGHGINYKEFLTKLTKKQARLALKLPSDKTIITFLGRIHKIKGLDQLIETIKLSRNDNFHFVIAGSDDGFLTELKSLIAKYDLFSQITLMGTCFGEGKARLFKASDIFIYPSYSEGFSLGILEAASAGLPMILSTGCHFDEVETKKAGLVVKNNPALFYRAIKKLAADSKLRQMYARNAHQLVEDKYSMAKIGNSLLKIYDELV